MQCHTVIWCTLLLHIQDQFIFCTFLKASLIFPQNISLPAEYTDLRFELADLEGYTKAQLKSFCKTKRLPVKSSSKKVELQTLMRAWAEAHPDLLRNTEEIVGMEVSPTEESNAANGGEKPLNRSFLEEQRAVSLPRVCLLRRGGGRELRMQVRKRGG